MHIFYPKYKSSPASNYLTGLVQKCKLKDIKEQQSSSAHTEILKELGGTGASSGSASSIEKCWLTDATTNNHTLGSYKFPSPAFAGEVRVVQLTGDECTEFCNNLNSRKNFPRALSSSWIKKRRAS